MNGPDDPLAALRPLHLPEAVSWWPPAPGWWLLMLLFLVIGSGCWWWWQRTALRRRALAELQQLARRQLDDRQMAAELNRLLRRVALARFPRHEVAPLCGEAWLQFLDNQAVNLTFRDGPGRALATLPYAPEGRIDQPALLALARSWIRQVARRRR